MRNSENNRLWSFINLMNVWNGKFVENLMIVLLIRFELKTVRTTDPPPPLGLISKMEVFIFKNLEIVSGEIYINFWKCLKIPHGNICIYKRKNIIFFCLLGGGGAEVVRTVVFSIFKMQGIDFFYSRVTKACSPLICTASAFRPISWMTCFTTFQTFWALIGSFFIGYIILFFIFLGNEFFIWIRTWFATPLVLIFKRKQLAVSYVVVTCSGLKLFRFFELLTRKCSKVFSFFSVNSTWNWTNVNLTTSELRRFLSSLVTGSEFIPRIALLIRGNFCSSFRLPFYRFGKKNYAKRFSTSRRPSRKFIFAFSYLKDLEIRQFSRNFCNFNLG